MGLLVGVLAVHAESRLLLLGRLGEVTALGRETPGLRAPPWFSELEAEQSASHPIRTPRCCLDSLHSYPLNLIFYLAETTTPRNPPAPTVSLCPLSVAPGRNRPIDTRPPTLHKHRNPRRHLAPRTIHETGGLNTFSPCRPCVPVAAISSNHGIQASHVDGGDARRGAEGGARPPRGHSIATKAS